MEAKPLTKKEKEIMKILWKIKQGIVHEIMEEMPEPKPAYNTVSSFIRTMVERGYIGVKKYGSMNIYFPNLKAEDYGEKQIGEYVELLHDGSYKNMITSFVKEEKITEDELKEILKLIKGNKKK